MSRISLLLLLLPILLAGCESKPEAPAKAVVQVPISKELMMTAEQLKRFEMTLERVERKKIPQDLDVAATIQVDDTLTTPVSSLTPGRIEDVKVKVGDHVQRGTILAQLRSDEIGTIQADFLQRMLELKAEAKQNDVKIDYLRKQFERKRFIFENKIGSKADLELAESDLKQSEAALESVKGREEALTRAAKERLKLHGIPASEIDRVLQQQTVNPNFLLRSPKAGVITVRNTDPGETVDVTKQLFVVTDLSRIWFIGQIFERDISKITLGMKVSCYVDSFPGQTFQGRLDYIGSSVDAQTRTLPVRVTVVNPGMELRPDMYGHMTMRAGELSVLAVSRDALQKIGETTVVYVYNGHDAFTERKVEPGQISGNQVEILSGLSPGETVVSTGSVHLLGKSLERLKN